MEVVCDLALEVVKGEAEGVLAAGSLDCLLPCFLRGGLLPFGLLHLDAEGAVEAVWLEEDEVGHSCDDAFVLELGSGDGIAPTSIGYGEEEVGILGVLEAEPPHAVDLYAVFLVVGFLPRLRATLLQFQKVVEGHDYLL